MQINYLQEERLEDHHSRLEDKEIQVTIPNKLTSGVDPLQKLTDYKGRGEACLLEKEGAKVVALTCILFLLGEATIKLFG